MQVAYNGLIVRLPAGAAIVVAFFRLLIRLAQMGLIAGSQVLLCLVLRPFGGLHSVGKGRKQSFFLPGQIFRRRANRKLFRPGELLVLCPIVFRVLILPLPPRYLRIIGEVEGVKPANLILAHIAGHRTLFHHFRNMCLIRSQLQRLPLNFLGGVLPLLHQSIHGAALLFGQRFAQIGLGVPGIVIQHVLKEAVRFGPVAVLQGHIASVQQGVNLFASAAADNDLLLYHGHRCGLGQELINAPEQVLYGPHLAHILGLELGKLLGHVIGVNVLVARDQVLALIRGHEL